MLYNNIVVTGASGFIGKNLCSFLSDKNNFIINKLKINSNTNLSLLEDTEVVIHLAGKAHDVKNLSNFNDYYEVNTEYTKKVFDAFLNSNANVFITLSSVKAVADELDCTLTEDFIPNPITHYGKSKLLAEQYIIRKYIPYGKRVYILRPCMVHGPGNKGNLNLLYKIVSIGLPWPLGAFNNKRSFCSIDNLCFIINELILNDQIESGIYNIADDEPISTNEIIALMSKSLGKNSYILNIPKYLIKLISKFGDLLNLPLNTERLNKLTETYIVSNEKINKAIKKHFPITSKNGLKKTFNSYKNNVK